MTLIEKIEAVLKKIESWFVKELKDVGTEGDRVGILVVQYTKLFIESAVGGDLIKFVVDKLKLAGITDTNVITLAENGLNRILSLFLALQNYPTTGTLDEQVAWGTNVAKALGVAQKDLVYTNVAAVIARDIDALRQNPPTTTAAKITAIDKIYLDVESTVKSDESSETANG